MDFTEVVVDKVDTVVAFESSQHPKLAAPGCGGQQWPTRPSEAHSELLSHSAVNAAALVATIEEVAEELDTSLSRTVPSLLESAPLPLKPSVAATKYRT